MLRAARLLDTWLPALLVAGQEASVRMGWQPGVGGKTRNLNGDSNYVMMQQFDKVLGMLERAFHYTAASVLALLMFLITADVVSRTFNLGMTGAIDISQGALVVIIYGCLAYTQSKGGHVRIDVVVSRLKPGVIKRAVLSLSYLLPMLAFAVLAWQGGVDAVTTWKQGRLTDVLDYPIFPLKIWLSACFGLLCLRFLIQLLRQGTVSQKAGK